MTRVNGNQKASGGSAKTRSEAPAASESKAVQIERVLSHALSEIATVMVANSHLGNRLLEIQRAVREAQIANNTNDVLLPAEEIAVRTGRELVSSDDLLNEFGISSSTFSRIRKNEGFPIGLSVSNSRIMFYRDEVDAWLHGRRIKQAPLRGGRLNFHSPKAIWSR